MPTILDVAKRAGVSLSTASDILNGKLKGYPETAERVRQAVRDLGYRPNLLGRRLRTARAGAFGLVVPYRRPIFSSALLTDALAGIQAEQEATGLNLVLAARRYEKPHEIYGADLFESRAVDGVLIIGTREAYARNLDRDVRALRKLGCPFVWLHYFKGQEQVDRVVRQHDDATAAVLQHLKERGRERVGFITTGVGLQPGEQPPLEGYLKRCEEHGLTTRAAWIGVGEAFDGGAFRAALHVLRQSERPDALICDGDDLAIAGLQAALGLGLKVPGQVAIASTSNYSIGEHAAVPITTYGEAFQNLGRLALRRLVDLIAAPAQPPREIESGGGLIARAST